MSIIHMAFLLLGQIPMGNVTFPNSAAPVVVPFVISSQLGNPIVALPGNPII
jgi:hypothetical protein